MSRSDIRRLMGLDNTRSSLAEVREDAARELAEAAESEVKAPTAYEGIPRAELGDIFTYARQGMDDWDLRELKLGIAGGGVSGDAASTKKLKSWLEKPQKAAAAPKSEPAPLKLKARSEEQEPKDERLQDANTYFMNLVRAAFRG